MGNLTSLGGALPLVTKSISGVNTIDTAINGNRNAEHAANLARTQQSARNRLEENVSAQKSALDTSILNATQSADERRRLTALKRATSRQRAIYGSSGLDRGGDTGSGEAVIFGLFNESDQDKATNDHIYNLRRRIIDDNIQNMRTRNLLDESQFLARKKIKSGGLL